MISTALSLCVWKAFLSVCTPVLLSGAASPHGSYLMPLRLLLGILPMKFFSVHTLGPSLFFLALLGRVLSLFAHSLSFRACIYTATEESERKRRGKTVLLLSVLVSVVFFCPDTSSTTSRLLDQLRQYVQYDEIGRDIPSSDTELL